MVNSHWRRTKMSNILAHKPFGGRLQQFRLKGHPVCLSHRVVGDHVIVLKLYLVLPNYDQRYVFSLQHFKNKKLLEAQCLREGHAGKTAAIEAIRQATLATRAEPTVQQALDDLKAEAVAEIGQFKPPPTVLDIVSESERQSRQCRRD